VRLLTILSQPDFGENSKKFKSVGRGSVTSPVVEISNRPRSGHEAEQERALDHDSIIVPTEKNMGKLECAHCGTTSTSLWRRAPGEVDLHKELPRVYCCDCGNDWVRYVALPSLADTPKEGKKLKGKDPTGKLKRTHSMDAFTVPVVPIFNAFLLTSHFSERSG
jgi:hypothetical protein